MGVPGCIADSRTPSPGSDSRSINLRKCAWADSEIWIIAASSVRAQRGTVGRGLF